MLRFLHNAGLYGRNGVLPAKLALREGEIFNCIDACCFFKLVNQQIKIQNSVYLLEM